MFKQLFKKYKNKCSPPNLEGVVVLNNICAEAQLARCCERRLSQSNETFDRVGLKPPDEWKVYHIPANPGLLIVKNPFTKKGQRFWIKKCLTEYPVFPNKTNLDIHGLLQQGENWWSVCETNSERREILQKKLRWITLGYHHNWDTKEYSEKCKSKMPQELIDLCEICAQTISNWSINAEAAIVNIYHLDSTLSGHVDYSEPNKEVPIFSFSFGSSAIFLIENGSDNASAILLESGDIAVMSGPSRLAMHGVPRIIAAKEPYPWSEHNDHQHDLNDWDLSLANFISKVRININVRQVLLKEQTTL